MSTAPPGFRIDLQYRFARETGAQRPFSHPLIGLLRAVRDGGSIQAAAKALDCSYRHAWGSLRAAEKSSTAPCCTGCRATARNSPSAAMRW